MAPPSGTVRIFQLPRRAYQTRPEKQTGFSATGLLSLRRYTPPSGTFIEKLSAARFTDILHGSYHRQTMQSPASPHNAACIPHRRSDRISNSPLLVKGGASIFWDFFTNFFRFFLCFTRKPDPGPLPARNQCRTRRMQGRGFPPPSLSAAPASLPAGESLSRPPSCRRPLPEKQGAGEGR